MDTNVKEYLHNIRMEDNDNEGFDIDKEDFENVLKKFNKKSYDFLLKSGLKYKEAMFKLCNYMIEKEDFPISFKKTLLNMIWK